MKKIIGLFLAVTFIASTGVSSENSFATNDVIEMSIADTPSYGNSEIVELTVVSSFKLSDTVFVVGQIDSGNRFEGLFNEADRKFNLLYLDKRIYDLRVYQSVATGIKLAELTNLISDLSYCRTKVITSRLINLEPERIQHTYFIGNGYKFIDRHRLQE